MKTVHRWFGSGSYSLAAHLDLPPSSSARLGAVLVPPFGWEDVCSYRSLRFLGQTLAANGIPALRFDLPGTGDSSGSATDSGLVDAWIQSVCDAVAELRLITGVENVTVVGIRLGAMLAAAAAARGAGFEDMVLWGPAVSGRTLLRELRALQKMEVLEYATGQPPPPQPVPGLEVFGFLLTPETQSALESLDLSALPPVCGRRVMALVRDDCPSDYKVIDALKEWGCAVEVTASIGYAGMMAPPHEAVAPEQTIRTVVDFMTSGLQQRRPAKIPSANHAARLPAVTTIQHAGSSVLESICDIRGPATSSFGILSEPAHHDVHSGLGLLLLNPGAARHIGPNRMWVEVARRWAARGTPALRMDFAGIGESDGDSYPDVASLYQGPFLEEVYAALEFLRARTGTRRFAVIGLCSGAFWSFHAAVDRPDIRGAILLNPRLFFWDPEVDRRRLLRSTINGLSDPAKWHRLATGRIKLRRIKQSARSAIGLLRKDRARESQSQIPAEELAHSLAAIERHKTRLTLVFTEGEPLLREMEDEAQLPPEDHPLIRCIRIPDGGHTFRPLWAQKLIHELIDRDLTLVLRDVSKDQYVSASR